jgi:hypothetical protein
MRVHTFAHLRVFPLEGDFASTIVAKDFVKYFIALLKLVNFRSMMWKMDLESDNSNCVRLSEIIANFNSKLVFRSMLV